MESDGIVRARKGGEVFQGNCRWGEKARHNQAFPIQLEQRLGDGITNEKSSTRQGYAAIVDLNQTFI